MLVFTILVSHFTICNSSKCRYPLCLMRAHRRLSLKTANSLKELAEYNLQVFQVPVLLAQEHQVQALWKKTTGRKESQKHNYGKWTRGEQQVLVRLEAERFDRLEQHFHGW